MWKKKQKNFVSVDRLKIHTRIVNLAAKNSSGPDSISSKLLKRLSEHVVSPLIVMINQSLTTGIFPSKLKMAKVIPIYKKDENSDLDNYRPISLLSSVSKIFEKTVFEQVYEYFHNNKLFYDNHYRFKKSHSTELAAMELIDRITGYLDSWSKLPVSVFFDSAIAFDTLNHAILLEKLKYYGFSGTSLNWFRSYLTDRNQFTEFSGVKSAVTKLTTGVPQGSILGLLFS